MIVSEWMPEAWGEPEQPEEIDQEGLDAALDRLYDGGAWTPTRDGYIRQMAAVGWTGTKLMGMAEVYVRPYAQRRAEISATSGA